MRSGPGGVNVLVLSAIVLTSLLGHGAPVSAQSPSGTLSAIEIAIACAPSLTLVPEQPPVHALRILSAQDTVTRELMGPGELVIIPGGSGAGLQLDQQYAIRREYAFGRPAKGQLQTIHTAGWLRIIAVNGTTAIAQIEQVCDGVIAGDYLEPFVAPAVPAVSIESAPGTLDFSTLARVVFGDSERRIAGPGDFLMLDRGNAPLSPGSRVAIYRDLMKPGVPLVAIAEGVIMTMSNGMPVMRVTTARDAVRSGDYVVPRR
jgi:hypothetical protein